MTLEEAMPGVRAVARGEDVRHGRLHPFVDAEGSALSELNARRLREFDIRADADHNQDEIGGHFEAAVADHPEHRILLRDPVHSGARGDGHAVSLELRRHHGTKLRIHCRQD